MLVGKQGHKTNKNTRADAGLVGMQIKGKFNNLYVKVSLLSKDALHSIIHDGTLMCPKTTKTMQSLVIFKTLP